MQHDVDLALLSSRSAGRSTLTNPQEFFLIRHATTDFTGSFCGQSDPPLNAMGRTQAIALAGELGSRQVRRLYASDLKRAVQTAQILGERWGIPVEAKSGFREISFGAWEGRRWAEIRAENPDVTPMESSGDFSAPGGESFDCFRTRVLCTLKQTLAECQGHLIAIVTHLGVIRVVLKELNSATFVWEPQQRIDHCSVYRMRADSIG